MWNTRNLTPHADGGARASSQTPGTEGHQAAPKGPCPVTGLGCWRRRAGPGNAAPSMSWLHTFWAAGVLRGVTVDGPSLPALQLDTRGHCSPQWALCATACHFAKARLGVSIHWQECITSCGAPWRQRAGRCGLQVGGLCLVTLLNTAEDSWALATWPSPWPASAEKHPTGLLSKVRQPRGRDALGQTGGRAWSSARPIGSPCGFVTESRRWLRPWPLATDSVSSPFPSLEAQGWVLPAPPHPGVRQLPQ